MKQVDMYKRAALIAVMGLSLAGCSTVKGWFAGMTLLPRRRRNLPNW